MQTMFVSVVVGCICRLLTWHALSTAYTFDCVYYTIPIVYCWILYMMMLLYWNDGAIFDLLF